MHVEALVFFFPLPPMSSHFHFPHSLHFFTFRWTTFDPILSLFIYSFLDGVKFRSRNATAVDSIYASRCPPTLDGQYCNLGPCCMISLFVPPLLPSYFSFFSRFMWFSPQLCQWHSLCHGEQHSVPQWHCRTLHGRPHPRFDSPHRRRCEYLCRWQRQCRTGVESRRESHELVARHWRCESDRGQHHS